MSNEWDGKVVMSTPGGPIVTMSLGDLLARKDAEIERLRAALRFYAEPYKYTDIHGDDVQVPDFYSETDFGETARLALKGKL